MLPQTSMGSSTSTQNLGNSNHSQSQQQLQYNQQQQQHQYEQQQQQIINNSSSATNIGNSGMNNNMSANQQHQVNFHSKFQSLQKLKQIQGGGGGSILSQNANGMSYQGHMESSNSSASNLSLKNRVNMSPQQQSQVIYNGSHKNLQKCNSSPMNSFIKNKQKRQQMMMTNSQSQFAINQQQIQLSASNNNILNGVQLVGSGGIVTFQHSGNIGHHHTNQSNNPGYNSTQPYRDLNYQGNINANDGNANPIDSSTQIYNNVGSQGSGTYGMGPSAGSNSHQATYDYQVVMTGGAVGGHNSYNYTNSYSNNYHNQTHMNNMNNNSKLVYKSNSQKSINWEGTPQNHTHKSINNKNTGSQSHQSLGFGSQGKGLQNSSKKMLMPSGSSGTLLRKEIIEMDEVNSSSSSSIGREDNVNMALNASSKMKKIGKLNFTGKPFAPDSVFINNLGKNLGDEDDGGAVDIENIDSQKSDKTHVTSNKSKKQHTSSQKNYHTTTIQSSQINTLSTNLQLQPQQSHQLQSTQNIAQHQQQQTISQLQQLKNQKVQKQVQSKKSINHRNISSPDHQSKVQSAIAVNGAGGNQTQQAQPSSLKEQIQFHHKMYQQNPTSIQQNQQLNSQSSGGRISVGFNTNSTNTNQLQFSNIDQNKKLTIKPKPMQMASAKYSPSNNQTISISNHLSQNLDNTLNGIAANNISDIHNITTPGFQRQESINNEIMQQSSQVMSGNQTNVKMSMSQTQKVRISFVEQSSHMNLLNSLSGINNKQDDSSIIVSQVSKTQVNTNKNALQANYNNGVVNSGFSGSTQAQQLSKFGKSLGSKNNTLSQKTSQRPSSNFLNTHDYAVTKQIQSNNQDINNQSTQQLNYTNQNLTQLPQYSSKSPAEKMIESSLLQQAVNVTQSSTLAGKHQKLMTQDLYGISSQILTPNRHSIQVNSRKNTAGNSYNNKGQVNKGSNLNKHHQPPTTQKSQLLSASDRKVNTGKSNKVSAKNSSHDLSNLSHDEAQSPTTRSRIQKNQGNNKMKGDSNNFNEISESIVEENADRLQDTEDESLKQHNQNYSQKNQLSINNKNSKVGSITVVGTNLFDQSRVSPNKSNKIPSSLAFKRRSNDQSLQQSDNMNSNQSIGQQNSQHQVRNKKTSGGTRSKLKVNNLESKRFNLMDSEDDQNILNSQRNNSSANNYQNMQNNSSLGVGAQISVSGLGGQVNFKSNSQMFTLKDKQELKRNIAKYNNLDFSNQYDSQGKYKQQPSGIDYFIEIISLTSTFLNFEHLMKIMLISKEFREDYHRNPTPRQIYIFKIFR
eukprot:403360748